jgi:hypothetical protein
VYLQICSTFVNKKRRSTGVGRGGEIETELVLRLDSGVLKRQGLIPMFRSAARQLERACPLLRAPFPPASSVNSVFLTEKLSRAQPSLCASQQKGINVEHTPTVVKSYVCTLIPSPLRNHQKLVKRKKVSLVSPSASRRINADMRMCDATECPPRAMAQSARFAIAYFLINFLTALFV